MASSPPPPAQHLSVSDHQGAAVGEEGAFCWGASQGQLGGH